MRRRITFEQWRRSFNRNRGVYGNMGQAIALRNCKSKLVGRCVIIDMVPFFERYRGENADHLL